MHFNVIKIMYFRARKRYSCRRMSVISDQTLKTGDGVKNKMPLNTNEESKRQVKRDSRHTIPDDEAVTDWIPEIPFFWNVSSNKSLQHSYNYVSISVNFPSCFRTCASKSNFICFEISAMKKSYFD